MSDLKDLQKRVADFIDARDWRQFHDDPKNTLLALGSEVGELMDLYRFTTVEQAKQRKLSHREDVEDEVADILYLLLMFCDENDIDLEQAFLRKGIKREQRYPVQKSRGVSTKYDKL
ncbi:MAG TPA: nucleotide pyrophosphohydrolase [Candidatus Saccharimonadales bacterium]|nr:nucleotide pyrophosphohydrolase [Candidatus Saccharimonadales bacterium]